MGRMNLKNYATAAQVDQAIAAQRERLARVEREVWKEIRRLEKLRPPGTKSILTEMDIASLCGGGKGRR